MLQKGIHMVDFIKPNGMSDDEVNQLNTRITMNVLYRALAAMPPELIDRALHDSTEYEIGLHFASLQQRHSRDNVIKKMMFIAMAENAYDQIQANLEQSRTKKTKRGKSVPLT